MIRLLGVIILMLQIAGCSAPRHNILGTTWGWEAEKVNVLSDLQINSLRVRYVRMISSECRSGFKDHLELSGPIGPDSSEVIERMLSSLPRCYQVSGSGWIVPVVYMHSNGGYLKDGYRLGLTFRKYEVQTIVTNGQFCASSCAIAFLGGKFRAMNGDAKLSFHSPYWRSGSSISCPSKEESNDLREYFSSFLDSRDAEFLFNRTMSFCSRSEGWTINSDAAKMFGIIK